MNAIIFVGPSLPQSGRPAIDGLGYRPPAALGDLLSAAFERPHSIGVVDGYFEGVPSVWHKEILWAMSQGVHVFGSGSMGALRAAELADFGMQGVGRIFEAYRDGTLTEDDEVAVLHGPPELGYVALTEPMVNIRFSLAKAVADGAIDETIRREVERSGKALFYKHRRWDAILAATRTRSPAIADDLEHFNEWLVLNAVDQKQADAIEMISVMTGFLDTEPPSQSVGFDFAWTQMWDRIFAETRGTASGIVEAGGTIRTEDVLDELRLDRDRYHRAVDRSLARHLAVRLARRLSLDAPSEDKRTALAALRATHGLHRGAELDAWLKEQHTNRGWLENVIEQNVAVDQVRAMVSSDLDAYKLDDLRLSGAYSGLVERAIKKRRALTERGLHDLDPRAANVTPATLLARYFGDEGIPTDIDNAARDLGLADREELYAMLLREHLYSTIEID